LETATVNDVGMRFLNDCPEGRRVWLAIYTLGSFDNESTGFVVAALSACAKELQGGCAFWRDAREDKGSTVILPKLQARCTQRQGYRTRRGCYPVVFLYLVPIVLLDRVDPVTRTFESLVVKIGYELAVKPPVSVILTISL
jgi:hypothetical protein